MVGEDINKMFFDFAYDLDSKELTIYAKSYINPISEESVRDFIQIYFPKVQSVLFDLLLCNGESFNRFCKFPVHNGNILFNDYELVTISNKQKLDSINRHYKFNPETLNKGVLTQSIIDKYK